MILILKEPKILYPVLGLRSIILYLSVIHKGMKKGGKTKSPNMKQDGKSRPENTGLHVLYLNRFKC